MIADNLKAVQQRIEAAARKAGRPPETVHLVVVSKTRSVDEILEAHNAGAEFFGENRVQEACDKIDRLADERIRWHFIGHLQKNKVKRIVGRTECIHSVDSVSLAESISEKSVEAGRVTPILIQVNISGEASKSGIAPESLEDTLRQVSGFPGVRVQGLMTIPPLNPDPEQSRPFFARLRQLRDDAVRMQIPGVSLAELSMGMSSDFEVAIEEGATWVRVGTAVFGERPE